MFKKLFLSFSFVCYLLSVSACGVILYPERQGQKGGQIDVAVALLDGVGLLLWVVPGLIAFAVDFHQGTIYLPNTQAAIDAGEGELREVKLEGELTSERIEAALQSALGYTVNLDHEQVQIYQIDSIAGDAQPTLALYGRASAG